jgi:hypothetical protein
LRFLLAATLSGAANIQACEMDLKRPGQPPRRVVMHAQRLVYLDLHHVRLLVAVSDVTDVRSGERIEDEALQRNLVLLQEVRRRVANSLQIIASVLLQNARRTQSDETRWHLKDAHHRVMSVAALEQQLAGSGEAEVELRAYFTELCASIAGSMINAGLGTCILQSLAKQLEASVVIATGHAGTRVSVEHIQVALVGPDELQAGEAPLFAEGYMSPTQALVDELGFA